MTSQYSKDYFKDKRITMMGLGLLGRSVGDAAYLAEAGAELIITDLKTQAELLPSIEKLSAYENIRYTLGEHRLEDFRDRDLIIKGPSVPLDSIYIEEARKHSITVEMSASLVVKLSGVFSIGVTGTRGKSTTTHLLYDILKRAGKQVLLGGNVKGVSNLALLDEITPATIMLMELDSWQLQGFGDSQMSPNVALFTTFMRDHMNYYHDDMEAYFADKANIFLYQQKDDALIVGRQVAQRVLDMQRGKFNASVQIADEKTVPADWELVMPGEHNRYNAGLAYLAAQGLGIPDEVIRESCATFAGVPGRLGYMGERGGVRIYNDTTSTTPDATRVGMKAVSENKNVILIMGGTDKKLDMQELVAEIPTCCRCVILLPGNGSNRIREDLRGVASQLDAFYEVTTLDEAVDQAFAEARDGDVILFSPGFTSFEMFNNEFHRGETFEKCVKKHTS